MKTMRRFPAFLAVLLLAVICCACNDAPEVLITDQSPTSTTADETASTAVADGRMTLSALMGEMGSTMRWDAIAKYDHTAVDDTHATFAVLASDGTECTLQVTYDPTTSAVSEATLSYGEVSVNVLSDDTLVIRTILTAMDEE